LANGHSAISRGFSFLKSSARDGGVNPLRGARGVYQLAAIVIAYNHGIEVPGAGV
jgi:hypothetical protein